MLNQDLRPMLIEPAKYCGYLIRDTTCQDVSNISFAGTLEECLSFVRSLYTVETRSSTEKTVYGTVAASEVDPFAR